MAVLAKPIDVAFVVKESKVNAFKKCQKHDRSKLKKILARAEKMEKNITHRE